jgi:lysophospholipase L1-like esterase
MLGLALTGAAVLGRRAAAFDPASLGQLVARYDAGAALFQDAGGTVPAGAGAPVGRVPDLSGNGYHLTQGAAASRPALKSVGGRASLHFAGAQWLDVPAALQLDKKNATVVAVLRSRSAVSQAIWHMPAGTTAHALLVNSGTAAGELRFFNEASRNSLIAVSHGLATLAAVNRAGQLELHCGPEAKTDLTASAAGTVAGGWVGQWAGGSFRLRGHLHEMLVYGRALAGAELAALTDHLERKHGALGRAEETLLIFEGDSITEGVGASNAEDFSYPAQLARRGPSEPKWFNLGAGGDTLQNMAATVSGVTALLARNPAYPNRLVGLLAGTNDINNGRTEAQVRADLDAWIAAVRGVAGVVPFGCTILPRTDFNPAEEAVRQAVNGYIRSGANLAFVVDLAAEPRLANPADAAIYGDGIHPTDAGYAVLAEVVHGALAARGYI